MGRIGGCGDVDVIIINNAKHTSLTTTTMSDGLKAQISTLEELQGRLGRVRQVPPSLLQTGTTEFGAVKAIGEAVLSEPVQTALARARESLEKDGPGADAVRRVNRKRR